MSEYDQPIEIIEPRKVIVYDTQSGEIISEVDCTMPDSYLWGFCKVGQAWKIVTDFPNAETEYVNTTTKEVESKQNVGGVSAVQAYVVGDTYTVTGLPEGLKVYHSWEYEDLEVTTVPVNGIYNYTFATPGTHYFRSELGGYIGELKEIEVDWNNQQKTEVTEALILEEEAQRISRSNWSQLDLTGTAKSQWAQYRSDVRQVKNTYAGELDYNNVAWPDPTGLPGYPSGA